MPLSCYYVRIVVFFPLICWGFGSKTLCTPEPYYNLEVSLKELLFALAFFYVSAVLFWVCGWFYVQPHLSITVLLSSEKQITGSQRSSKGLTFNSTASLPLWTIWTGSVCRSGTNRHSSPLIYLSCRFISSSRRPDWGARTEPPG